MRAISLAIGVAGLAVAEGAATQQPLNGGDQSRDNAVSKDLDGYIEGLMKEWNVPGLSVSIVDGDETWAKGYGYATFNSTPATPHTLYYTGSTTKSFTAAGISLLIDNATSYGGLLDRGWQTPVSSILREDFVLSDDWATAHVTLEDALSHRTGYPRHDLASQPTTREEVRSLRNLPMSAEPRQKFQYCNKMFGVAGYLIETLTGKWLGDFFKERLWAPMGMNETYFSLKDAEASPLDLATEYAYDAKRGKFIDVPHEPYSSEEGAGSVVSNVLDYAKYLRVMMDEEGPISKAGHRELKTPRTIEGATPPFLGPVLYSLGWSQAVFEGETAFFHGGVVTMFWSYMIMVPSRKLAVTVMSNTESRLPYLVAYQVLYDRFGVPEEKRVDMNKINRYRKGIKQQQEWLENCDAHIYPNTPSPPLLPTLPIADHVGEYTNPGYGKLTIELYCYEDDRGVTTRPTSGEQCRLRVLGLGGPGLAYLEPAIYLAPKSGDYWVARDYTEVGGLKEVETPSICMRAEFKVGVGGEVTHFGLDVRLEGLLNGALDGEDGPLVWFERV
ncbi:penicillin-binding protein [Colletotrichum musicola]|uniref:Penicillin-binding protein n=1 Tax=Colletotrichum musicola TaxID=2175873 RepID=A0A8H6N8E0_9PEZI|nr:penicillin-binding protein [Colletotrichum musicola]